MTIDIHGHVTSPELFERLPMPPSLADIGGMVEQKAAAGIELTLVGSPVGAGTMVPVPGLDNYAQPVDKLDAFHEWVAETVREHAPALRGYVYLNPFDPDLVELAERRLKQDEFVGLIVNTSVRGRYLDTDEVDGFFALAAQTRAPVLLHAPAEPVGADALGHVGLVEHVARPCDITAGVAAILLHGWLDRYPELRLIASTAGGALPLLAEKLDLAQRRGAAGGPPRQGGPPPADTPPPPPVSASLKRIYVDTATPSAVALRAALAAFGPDHLLFGTDSPPLTGPLTGALALVDSLGLPAADRDRVLGGTARELFGLDGAR